MEPPAFEDELALIVETAAEAGRIAMHHFRHDPKVWWKEGNSPVSEADFAVDAYLREALLSARPDYGWLSEETERPPSSGGFDGRFFVVDPIDGTRAFLRGEETWCVSIALVEAGRPVAGVLDMPARREVFSAIAGGPACLDGRPIAVSRTGGATLRVSMPEMMRQRLDAEALRTLSFEKPAPSLAYRLAEVACGRLDGTLIRPQANDWDIAAGDLILERAGGALENVSGEPRPYGIEGRRHGVLLAGADHALPALRRLAGASAAG